MPYRQCRYSNIKMNRVWWCQEEQNHGTGGGLRAWDYGNAYIRAAEGQNSDVFYPFLVSIVCGPSAEDLFTLLNPTFGR